MSRNRYGPKCPVAYVLFASTYVSYKQVKRDFSMLRAYAIICCRFNITESTCTPKIKVNLPVFVYIDSHLSLKVQYKSLIKTKKNQNLKHRVASANAILKHYKSSSLITAKRHAMALSIFKS